MPKVLIIFDSFSGNTKRMAEEVARGVMEVEGVEATVKHVEEAKGEDLLKFDGLIVGSPTHCGVVSWRIKKFFDENVDIAWGRVKGKIGAAFTSSGGLGGGNEFALLSIISLLMNYGYLVFGLPDYSAPKVTAHYGAVAVGTPQVAELKACRMLGRQMAEYLKMIKRD
ncbi:MAG: flavodoxin domain-containing protein [Dictyoglomus sp.]|nr:flavodoxin domain-containing protein [Dictyoglomus sp.]MDW8188312.1 flavodoxin domain-containing protein [Dictyoglomus sp.]